MTVDTGFDYEPLGSCQHGGHLTQTGDVVPCGAPAVFRVWWEPDKKHFILVCARHFRQIERSEQIWQRRAKLTP